MTEDPLLWERFRNGEEEARSAMRKRVHEELLPGLVPDRRIDVGPCLDRALDELWEGRGRLELGDRQLKRRAAIQIIDELRKSRLESFEASMDGGVQALLSHVVWIAIDDLRENDARLLALDGSAEGGTAPNRTVSEALTTDGNSVAPTSVSTSRRRARQRLEAVLRSEYQIPFPGDPTFVIESLRRVFESMKADLVTVLSLDALAGGEASAEVAEVFGGIPREDLRERRVAARRNLAARLSGTNLIDSGGFGSESTARLSSRAPVGEWLSKLIRDAIVLHDSVSPQGNGGGFEDLCEALRARREGGLKWPKIGKDDEEEYESTLRKRCQNARTPWPEQEVLGLFLAACDLVFLRTDENDRSTAVVLQSEGDELLDKLSRYFRSLVDGGGDPRRIRLKLEALVRSTKEKFEANKQSTECGLRKSIPVVGSPNAAWISCVFLGICDAATTLDVEYLIREDTALYAAMENHLKAVLSGRRSPGCLSRLAQNRLKQISANGSREEVPGVAGGDHDREVGEDDGWASFS